MSMKQDVSQVAADPALAFTSELPSSAAARLGVLTVAKVRFPLLVTSGVLGALAFPTTDWSLFAWVWVAPSLACALVRPPRGALADGWLAGTVFFVILFRWLDHTFRYYSAIPWPLGWLPIIALAAYCGLYLGLITCSVAWLRERFGDGWILAAVPVLWVAGEWVRGHLMDGFPWGLLGYSQHSNLAIIQIAELTGVYGVSFVVASVNAGLAAGVGLGWRRALPGLVATTLVLAGVLSFGVLALRGLDAERGRTPEIRVAVIQPSIEQSLKWDPARRAEAIDVLERLTRQAAQSRPAAIVWPETAAAIVLRRDPALLARFTTLSAELATPLLIGSVDRMDDPRGQPLNSAFLLTGQGIRAKYDKIHLVPFGEYVPLSWLVGALRHWAEFISEFSPGRARTIFPLPGASFGTVICYEGIFPELFREFVAGGAVFMVNITNDAWFGRTSGPWQHLGMLPLRAVENRVSIARAANTGVSAFVESSGRVAETLGLFERGVLEKGMAIRSRTTVYTRFGDWFAYACLATAAAPFGIVLLRKRERRP
jgi:apolipoprotein N-acyltransferase